MRTVYLTGLCFMGTALAAASLAPRWPWFALAVMAVTATCFVTAVVREVRR